MSVIRKLAGQTIIYGLSSIIGRFLNYLLVPLHTSFFTKVQYGIVTEMYAYVSFLVVLFTYGMETAFFRFYNKWLDQKDKVYSTALISLLFSSIGFILICYINAQPIAEALGYPGHSEYITWFAIIVGFDAISALPLAKLRAKNEAMRFARINIISVGVNIALNMILIMVVMPNSSAEIGIGYIFIANLISSIVKLVLLIPEMINIKLVFDFSIWKKMIRYAWPILFLGLAGIINETLDRILIKDIRMDVFMDQGKDYDTALAMAQAENGIYGAVYKISMLITLFVQAFRYAAEPFFFSEASKSDAKKTYAKVMTYFIIVVATIFLGVMTYIDIIKYMVPKEEYWVGLEVVPILLFANIFLGVYYNQSVWYKLTDKTIWGLYIAGFGALVTIGLNLILIPEYSYIGSAWATYAAYASMMLISYLFGQKYYKIPYNLKKIGFYIILSLVLYVVNIQVDTGSSMIDYVLKTLVFGIYLFIIWGLERPYLLFKK